VARGPALEPARIAFDADGTPRSADYGDVYHNDTGGLGQARHVFIAGNGLPEAWAARENFAIFETGFGLGLNFLATWQAWRDDPRRAHRLHYFSVEKHPPDRDDLARAYRHHGELAPLSAQLVERWPERLAGFHRVHFEQGRVTLTLLFGDARHAVGQVQGRFDAFYLDGFSPERNPELWSPALMADLAWLAAPDATCATYTIARTVRDALTAAGFAVEKRPGYGSKRDMLAGRHAGPAQPDAAGLRPGSGPVAVVGAGIAGVAIAERLAARGREVILLEAQARPAQGATGNHVAIMMPVLALDETRLARLNRAAFLYALRRLEDLERAGHAPNWSPCGVLQMPRSSELGERQARLMAEQGLPASFAGLVDAVEARARAGTRTAGGGWWFPRGGWVAPASLCAALLAAADESVRLLANAALARIEPAGDGWALYGHDGTRLTEAAAVVLAHSHGMLALPQAAHLPVRCFRGQVDHFPAQAGDPPRCVVCGDGYVAPPVDGLRCVGATFQRGRDTALHPDDHAANLARLAAMLPELAAGIGAAPSGRVGLRPVSPDKLPLLGALPLAAAQPAPASHLEWPRRPGLYVATGYGARGLVWSHLMAELLASELCGEPLPLEGDLAAAVDPARFAWKGVA
jgi:tRNA 5-methylaminomethyl-2-thiouridine biosynthesis bifunctional protein